MIKFFLGMLVGAFLLALAGYLFITQGGVQMGTTGGPLPMEESLVGKALSSSIGRGGQKQSPLPADETNLLAGARVFQERGCQGCHGRLDKPDSGVGRRFYPPAPHLLPPSKGVTDDPVGRTHWVVEHGVRFSGMPSYNGKLSDTEIWQVSLLLRNADKLPNSVQAELRK
jgi:mono/diheme cytochrome c family protein